MVKQKLFKRLGLLQISDEKHSQLYRYSKAIDEEAYIAEVFPFLPEPQEFLQVYPEANLIVTQDTLMTTNGKILISYEHAKVSVELVSDKWLIIEDTQTDSDNRYKITFWDGKRESGYIYGKSFFRTEKYLAVYISSDDCWNVFSYDGKLTFEAKKIGTDVHICGDFLLTSNIGNCTAYALVKEDNGEQPVFKHQQLVLCSSWDNFILYSSIQGVVCTYYRGTYSKIGRVDAVELFDRAGAFVVKRNGRYFLYKFNGMLMAENICPYGADKIAYNAEENTILINTNGIFHII